MVEDGLEDFFEGFRLAAEHDEKLRNFMHLLAVRGGELTHILRGVGVRGDEELRFERLYHVERLEEFRNVVDEDDVIFFDYLAAEYRVGEEADAVVGHYPYHVEVVARQLYDREARGQSVFYAVGLFRRLRHEEFIAQLRVWIAAVEHRAF